MKTWSKPEISELNINSTEYYATTGTTVDGHYASDDGKFTFPTYSGANTSDLPFFE